MALFSSHLLQYSELKLGERIRDARQRQGLTLRQLASRLGTSSARLSQIENERVRVHLQDVLEVAEALNIPLDALIPTDVTLPYQITRDTDWRARPPKPTLLAYPDGSAGRSSPHQYWSLANLFLGRHLEPVLGRIMPIDEHELCFCYHDEEEFAFALRGTLEFRIKTPEGEHREELVRGDSVYFRSDLPHCFRSLEAEPAETIHVFCSPSVSTAGGLQWAHSRAIVYTGDGGSNLQRRIGQKLMLLREEHGWSLDRVARSAGLSDRQVLGIERGERAIPLDAALNLARAFGKPLRELIGLTVARPPYYFVQRSKDISSSPSRRRRTPVERPHAPPSKTCQPLLGDFPAKEMYPCFLRMLNVDLETLTLHEHHGQEFIYVLEGELELTTYAGDEEVHETLRAGDSCYIDSTVPHLLRSWTRNPYSETSAEVLDVFWCPLGEAYLFDT
jgi:transcriptional regulator with XRE-family HTH domain/quercetin dioxygenase-like cupin family protein